MPRFGGIPYDAITDVPTRQAFRRLCEVMGNMFLTGKAAERPTTARLGAYWVTQDAGQEVYWYAGESIGWLLIASLTSAGQATLDHNLLKDLQGGLSEERYHLASAEHTALVANYPFSPNAVLYADADGYLATDPNFIYKAGYLGLGIASPTAPFHIRNNITGYQVLVERPSDGIAALVLGNNVVGGSGTNHWVAVTAVSGENAFFRFYAYADALGATNTAIAELSRGGAFRASPGSASAPAFSWMGRTTDGLWSPAAGEIGFATAATGRARLTATELRPEVDGGLWAGAPGQRWKGLRLQPHASLPTTDGEITFYSPSLAPVVRYKTVRRLGGVADPLIAEHTLAPPSTSGDWHTGYTIAASQWVVKRIWKGILHGVWQIQGQGVGESATLDFALYLGAEKICGFSKSVGPEEDPKRGAWLFDLLIACDQMGAADTMEIVCRAYHSLADSLGFAKGRSLAAVVELTHVDECFDLSTSSDHLLRVKVTANKALSAMTFSRQRGLVAGIDVV